ncbi:MAG TPA: EVE domain-containing protein [Gemmatimonadales bacterium]|nr:EVE domain-containing protein [Gemmatimonadales bacterium]
MTAHWILKTEPSTYSFDRLLEERKTVWDGVSNPVALKHLREMTVGDQVMIYHTGDVKAVVGLARITRAAYPDPKDSKLVVVEIEAGERLPHPVTLAAIKADPAFADLALVRMGRLSVVPVKPEQWKQITQMAEEQGEGERGKGEKGKGERGKGRGG